MKLTIILLVTCACIFASHAATQISFNELKTKWQDVLMEHIDDCIKESGADRELAERILPYGEYPENKKLKCFAKCVCSGLHMVGDDAEAHNYDFLDKLQIVDSKLKKKAISKCVKKHHHDNDCAQAYYTSKCIYFLVKKGLSEGIEALEKFEL